MDEQTRKFTTMASGWYGDTASHVKTLKMMAKAYGESSPQFAGWCALQERISKQLAAPAPKKQTKQKKSAWSEIEAKARAYAEKRTVTFEQAVSDVLENEPDLYYQYQVEQFNPA